MGMIEQDDLSKSDGLVEDVDAVHMGDGCFSAYGARNIRFVRTRCRDNHCTGWSGRDTPSSHGLLFAAGDENGCNCTNIQLEDAHFALRTPPSVSLCWDEMPPRTFMV